MATSVRASGTWAAATTQNVAYAIPAGYQAGDLGILVSIWKPYTVTATVNQSWVELLDVTTGATSNGNGTGSLRLYVATKVLAASETNPTVTRSGAVSPGGGVIIVLQKASTEVWDVEAISAAVESAAQNFSHAITTTAGITSGDWVFALTGVADESAAFTRATTAISGGPTWSGNIVEYPATHLSSTAGNDCAADLIYRVASSTVASGQTVTVTGSLSASERCGSVLFTVGVFTISGSGAVSVAAPAVDADGTQTLPGITGDGALAVAAPAVEASGAETMAGSAAIAVAAPTVEVSGAETMAGSAVLALAAPSVESAGSEAISGTAAVAVTGPTVAVVGSETITGTASLTVGTRMLRSDADLSVVLVADQSAAELEADGTWPDGNAIEATGVERMTGTSALVVGAPAVDATGSETLAGIASVTVAAPTVDASGTQAAEVTGTAALSVMAPRVSAVGKGGVIVVEPPIRYGRTVRYKKVRLRYATGTAVLAAAAPGIVAAGSVDDDELALALTA